MNAIKLFGIVFVAALAANVSAPMLMDLRWDFAADVLSADASIRPLGPETRRVTFRNTSGKTAKCALRNRGAYLPFLVLASNQSKRFDKFKIGSAIRCWTFIDAQSTTILTYLTVSSAGKYEILQDKVACSTCNARTWRWATVVVDPSGVPHSSKLTSN